MGRIVKDEEVDQELAAQIMDSALGFLYLSATNPGQNFSPSPLVDIGWHTFIMYTSEYAEFCDRMAGRFIHHRPNDDPSAVEKPGGIARTREALVSDGLPLIELIWTGSLSRRKIVAVSAGATVKDDCDNGGGGPGDECTCS